MTFYDDIGGQEAFNTLVHEFYRRMRTDDLIGPMYPDDDWEGAEERLKWFLAQYWGGPQTFTERRGHPRLRMRHAHFSIGVPEAQRWLEIMKESLDTLDLDLEHRAAMWDHMVRVADMLINRLDEQR